MTLQELWDRMPGYEIALRIARYELRTQER